MRIECLQHAGDGAVDQPVRLEVADVIGFNRRQCRREDLVLLGDLVLGEGNNNVMLKLVGKNDSSSALGFDLISVICVRAPAGN